MIRLIDVYTNIVFLHSKLKYIAVAWHDIKYCRQKANCIFIKQWCVLPQSITSITTFKRGQLFRYLGHAFYRGNQFTGGPLEKRITVLENPITFWIGQYDKANVGSKRAKFEQKWTRGFVFLNTFTNSIYTFVFCSFDGNWFWVRLM